MKEMDAMIIGRMRRTSDMIARLALFVIFFWFGALKVAGLSPANPLVEALMERTLPFLTFSQFIVGFGLFEMLIGVAFIVKGWERFAIALLVPHMITTILPLFLLRSTTWSGFLVPTLEGQYIIKNLALIACAIVIGAHLRPMKSGAKHA